MQQPGLSWHDTRTNASSASIRAPIGTALNCDCLFCPFAHTYARAGKTMRITHSTRARPSAHTLPRCAHNYACFLNTFSALPPLPLPHLPHHRCRWSARSMCIRAPIRGLKNRYARLRDERSNTMQTSNMRDIATIIRPLANDPVE